MASAAATSRSAPQAWLQPAGLILAFLGFVVASFSYTGPRAYDLKYFYVALAGLAAMVGGVLVAGWGRTLGRSGPRRAKATAKADPPAEAASSEEKPGRLKALLSSRSRSEGKAPASPFAGWRGKAAGAEASPEAKAEPEPEPVEAPAEPGKSAFAGWASRLKPTAKSTVTPAAESQPQPPAEEAPVPPVPAPPESHLPVTERLTVACPRCATEFVIEGTRPIAMTCPECRLQGTIR